MKTITEFAGATLKNALKTKQELTTAGKTPEELPAAMGEALKLEGDKLTILLSAIEVVEKKTNDLKRVVVWSLQEGEKAPKGTEQKGDHYFAIEFFPPLPGQARPGQKKHGGRGGKGDDRKKGKRRGRGPRRDERGQGEGAQAAGAAGEGKPGEGKLGERRPRRRRPRGPRREGQGTAPVQAADPSVKLPPIKPRETPLAPATPEKTPETQS